MRRPTLSILAVAVSLTACGQQVDPKELDSLNQELQYTLLDDALAHRSHFAPLCDEHGYPLVGNLGGKTVTTASQFCSALRGT